MLKVVGSDTLEAFGRQLVALHSPASVDWQARFGLATSPPQSSTPAPAERPWLVKCDGPCTTCGKTLVKGTPAVWDRAARRMTCLVCDEAL
jgi:hypothetical protein